MDGPLLVSVRMGARLSVAILGLGAAAITATLAACIGPQPFACESDDQCRLDGRRGSCEPERFCSYPDGECESGMRFEAYAAGALAGRCVELSEAGSSGSGDSSGSEAGSDESTGTTGGDGCLAFDMVGAGLLHTCARDTDGFLWCWGSNLTSQLGQGSPVVDFIVEPTRIEGPGRVVAFDGSRHTCAINEDNELWCWGYNDDGQSDWADTEIRIEEPRIIEAPAGTLNSVATGDTATCVSLDDAVYCWGTLLGSAGVMPTPIPGVDEPLVAMAGGRAHACGLTADGRVLCWGEDDLGQLGDGAGIGSGEAVPVDFIADGVVRSLAVGDDHSCAVFEADGTQSVRCWGANGNGETGLLLESQVPFPHTAIGGLAGGEYIGVAAGAAHGCAATKAGELHCWGDNSVGQADWQSGALIPGPNAVMLPFGDAPPTVALSAGSGHTCALRSDGTLDCWGCNEWGQLGGEPRQCREDGDDDDAVTVRICARP